MKATIKETRNRLTLKIFDADGEVVLRVNRYSVTLNGKCKT